MYYCAADRIWGPVPPRQERRHADLTSFTMRTASVLIAALAAAVHSIDVYKDPTAPIAQRVKDLLGKVRGSCTLWLN